MTEGSSLPAQPAQGAVHRAAGDLLQVGQLATRERPQVSALPPGAPVCRAGRGCGVPGGCGRKGQWELGGCSHGHSTVLLLLHNPGRHPSPTPMLASQRHCRDSAAACVHVTPSPSRSLPRTPAFQLLPGRPRARRPSPVSDAPSAPASVQTAAHCPSPAGWPHSSVPLQAPWVTPWVLGLHSPPAPPGAPAGSPCPHLVPWALCSPSLRPSGQALEV